MTETVSEQGYTTDEACDLTGLSFRQLDYWDRTDLIHPTARPSTGSGIHRRWSTEDIAVLRLIAGALDLGVSLDAVRRIVPALRAALSRHRPIVIATDEGVGTLTDLAEWPFDRPSIVIPVPPA